MLKKILPLLCLLTFCACTEAPTNETTDTAQTAGNSAVQATVEQYLTVNIDKLVTERPEVSTAWRMDGVVFSKTPNQATVYFLDGPRVHSANLTYSVTADGSVNITDFLPQQSATNENVLSVDVAEKNLFIVPLAMTYPGSDATTFAVDLLGKTETHAYGTYTGTAATGEVSGYFYATANKPLWNIVYVGQEVIPCVTALQYNFPLNLAPHCDEILAPTTKTGSTK